MSMTPTAAELAEWQRRRFTPPDVKRRLELVAEHEAAHGVVADALGVRVGELRAGPDGGATTYSSDGVARQDHVVIALAGTIWISLFRSMQYPEGDANRCVEDRRTVAFHADAWGAREARRRVHDILSTRTAQVLDLAADLARERLVLFDEWRTGTVRSRRVVPSARDLWEWSRR